MSNHLDGKRILIVEDDYLAVLDMAETIRDWGATIVGPVAQLDQALELVRSEKLDGVILDVKLQSDLSYPIADELIGAGIPVIFTTGYDMASLPDRFASVPKLAKPFNPTSGEKTLMEVFCKA